MREILKRIGIGLLLFVAGVAVGWFRAPTEIRESKTESKSESLKKSLKADRDSHVKTQVKETIFPDGRKETLTEILRDSELKYQSDSLNNTESVKAETKEVKRGIGLNFSLLAGPNLSKLPELSWCIGGQANKTIFGPLTIGAWGTSCKDFGVQLGLQF